MKLNTIRPKRRRPIKPGDQLSLRCWKGRPYHSEQGRLGEAVCTSVEYCVIGENCAFFDGYTHLGRELLDPFAKADGFKDWDDMQQWFHESHSLPFEGVLIKWTLL
jgi:hypothetical protein